ncbi:hypothetical protein [Roseofilum casamattae]|uniref:Secreted protein n=1 Tax=Roseofilum casamattae BLCC-M143 TaxID=3022442 RepID=A0ABT7C340_9CYAN|nr:hypothetical protein [Roseofilum casamattae]MDJ1185880.1 hypothetical protein [Roseofilum casamattae BLCC-M143]
MNIKSTALLLAVLMMELASAFVVLVGEPSVALVSYTNLVDDKEDRNDDPLVPTNLQLEFVNDSEDGGDDPIVPPNIQSELGGSKLPVIR